MDAVSEILVDRSREADKISRMVIVSLALHAALISAVAFVPSKWNVTPDNRQVMTISLGGAPGPEQGRNPISAKAQEAAPEPVKTKSEPTPPVAKPEMVEPVKHAPKVTKLEKPKDAEQTKGRTTPATETKQGVSKVETGSQTQTKFGGLATGGGGGGQAYTDYADFCCPQYLDQLVQMVRRNWLERQGQTGENIAKFTIRRDGMITDIEIEKGATPLLDLATKRALIQTQKLPPLPAAFTGPQLTVHLVFQYQR